MSNKVYVESIIAIRGRPGATYRDEDSVFVIAADKMSAEKMALDVLNKDCPYSWRYSALHSWKVSHVQERTEPFVLDVYTHIRCLSR